MLAETEKKKPFTAAPKAPDVQVLVLHASAAKGGGIVTATIFYAAALIKAGHPAEIWTPSKALAERAQELGVPVFYHRAFLNSLGPIFHPAIAYKAFKAKKRLKAVIHPGDKHWLFGQIWLNGVPESVVFHNEKINKRRLFKHWLAISARHRQDLEAFAAENRLRPQISLIRNGPLPDAASLLKPRPAKPIKTIGSLSDFGGHKGIDILIRAFAIVSQQHPDLRLVLGGDGLELQRCQELALNLGVNGRIDWLGWVKDTGSFFERIDLFCLPSRMEPFGIVITEAMKAGLPVIATDTMGPRDVVVPGKTGWIVPAGDAAAIAHALSEAVVDPNRTAAYGAAGFERYREFYSLEAAGRVLSQVLGLA